MKDLIKAAARHKAWNLEHKEEQSAKKKARYAAHKKEILAVQLAKRKEDPRPTMIASAKMRAKRDGYPFTITKEDIVIPTHCPVLGVPLVAGDGSPTENSPSLDKIVPELGYVPGNVIVVSFKANAIKRDASIDELLAVAKFYARLTAASPIDLYKKLRLAA